MLAKISCIPEWSLCNVLLPAVTSEIWDLNANNKGAVHTVRQMVNEPTVYSIGYLKHVFWGSFDGERV